MNDTRAQPEDNGIVSAPSRDCRMSMAPSASPRSAGHILLVEDDAEISRMLRQVLSENGFTTTCVMSPTDMEPVLARGNVDLMRSEAHTSELKSLMRSSYAVLCSKQKITT